MASTPSVTKLSHLNKETENVVSHYSSFFDKGQSHDQTQEREDNAKELVQSYYELVTDFYEYGYGECFHFFPVYGGQSFKDGLTAYEKEIAKDLKVKPGAKILDAGCGIGGPARVIARQTGANITGLNISDYQLRRARALTEKVGLQQQCTFEKGDFCDIHMYSDNTFDACYAIESTCHSKDPLLVYKEIYRVLKPGAYFVDSAWVMTDKYQPGNPVHEKIKHQIMEGDALPDIRRDTLVLSKLKEAGMEIVECVDYRLEGDLPWCTYLTGNGCCSLQAFRTSSFGRACTHMTLTALEFAHIVPQGSTKVHNVLQTAAKGLIAGAKTDIFTPLLRIVARKPLKTN